MRIIRAVLMLLAAAMLGAAPSAAQITVKLIAINDFHGYLEPSETFALPDPSDPQKTIHVPVGGAAYLATAIAGLKAANPRNVVIGAGDMVGASPLGSALFHDEPTIQALNAMGLEFTSVGNHEFDEGKAELLRKQHGGCRPGGKIGVDTCVPAYDEANRHRAYLCASGQGTSNPHVFYTSAGKYGQIVSDINVSLDTATGTIANIAARNDLVVNDRAPNPLAATVPALTPNPAIAALVARYERATRPLVDRVIGHATTDITIDGMEVARGGSGETAMGDVIADARIAATSAPPQAAAIAFINAGGVRSFLRYNASAGTTLPGDVTFGEAYNVEPFGDLLYTETLTGAQLITLLDEQWLGKKDAELLGVSHGLTYTWDASKPDGSSKLLRDSVKFNGKPLDLADGGDGFVVLRQGTQKVSGPIDLDALDGYLAAHSPLAPPPSDRIVRLH